MDAAHDNRRQLGQLMVEEGFITMEQLTRALAEQDSTGRPLGKVLVELGFVSEGAVANALAEQHGGLLKTEFGISAGLHAVQGGAARQATAAAADPVVSRVAELEAQLQGVLRERNALTQTLNELKLRQAETPPAADPAGAARVGELEAQLESVLAERNMLAQNLNELKLRQPETVLDPAAEARMAELESQLEQVLNDRNALTQKVNELQARPAQTEPDPDGAARIVELETHLHEVLAERNDFAQRLNDLQARLAAVAQAHEGEIAHVTEAAEARVAALDQELKSALATRSELEAAVAELRERLEQQPQAAAEPQQVEAVKAPVPARAHLLFVPSASGYVLVDFEGPDPPSGTVLDVEGVSYVVRRVGSSPFPGDQFRCVYLDPV